MRAFNPGMASAAPQTSKVLSTFGPACQLLTTCWDFGKNRVKAKNQFRASCHLEQYCINLASGHTGKLA